MKDPGEGPLHKVQPFNGYVLNGYKFHIEEYNSNKSTMRSGICINVSSHSANEIDYYGILTEILELEYHALAFKQIMLFKFSLFDPTKNLVQEYIYNIIFLVLTEKELLINTSHLLWLCKLLRCILKPIFQ